MGISLVLALHVGCPFNPSRLITSPLDTISVQPNSRRRHVLWNSTEDYATVMIPIRPLLDMGNLELNFLTEFGYIFSIFLGVCLLKSHL